MNFLKRLVMSNNFVISNFVKFSLNFKEFFDFACKTGLNMNMSGSEITFTMHKRLLNKFLCIAYNVVFSIHSILFTNFLLYFLPVLVQSALVLFTFFKYFFAFL